MNYKIKKLSTIFLACMLIFNTNAQIKSTQVDDLVKDAMEKFNVAGVSVGIVKNGKIIHTKGYGVASTETKKETNKYTQFAIASNSKAYTATALAILVDKGKINWTDKVKTYIPEFKMYNSYVTENFTIKDLLTHRSGLGLGVGDLMLFTTNANFTITDILNSFQYFKPVSDFRTKFDYDNLLYLVAGEVIKRVCNKSWEEVITEKIITPLQMKNTFASLSFINDRSNLATPHVNVGNNLEFVENEEKMINGAAGGIYSSAYDQCLWMLVNLNSGKYGKNLEKTLFTEKSQQEIWKIQTVTNTYHDKRYNSHFSGYGLGYFLNDVKGYMQVSHTGALPGMLSKTVMIPDLNLGVVVLTNTSENGAALFSAVSKTIIDSYLGLDDFKWTDKYYERFKKSQHNTDSVINAVWNITAKANTDLLTLNDYVGIYQDNWFGNIEISIKNNQLWFHSVKSPNYSGFMHFYKANTFAIRWEHPNMNADAFAMFTLDEEGKAQTIKMKGISPNIDFSYDFQDLNLKRIK